MLSLNLSACACVCMYALSMYARTVQLNLLPNLHACMLLFLSTYLISNLMIKNLTSPATRGTLYNLYIYLLLHNLFQTQMPCLSIDHFKHFPCNNFYSVFSATMPKNKIVKDEAIRSRAPKGHFVVYVGTEMKRFVVPTSYLKNPIFQQLLDKAAEEYGFHNKQNKIILPCDESTFQRLSIILSKQS